MQLYSGSSQQFVEDAVRQRIAEKLKSAFFHHFRFDPPQSEIRSWQNSLTRMCMVIQHAALVDHGILLEYQLPLTSRRLDCMITGRSASRAEPNAVIVELKQWETATASHVEDCVTTFVGGALRTVLHPSRQVGNYQQYLEDCHTAFTSGDVRLSSCAYLHNQQYDATSELLHPRHREILSRYPLFTGDQYTELADFLTHRVGSGDGLQVLATVEQSRYRASKKLLEHTSEMIRREPVYVLLDEQQVVFNSVLATVRARFHDRRKTVILIKGGPGTGKSVLAVNLMAELSGSGYNAQHATGSKAFTETLRKIVGPRAGQQFRYFNQFGSADWNAIDVLVLDEAHRLRPTSNNQYTKKEKRSSKPQIHELIDAAKVAVFFIDDLQIVRPGEVGSSQLIRDAATEAGAALEEYELEAQFRCSGSDAFINWINNTLGIRRTANILWDCDDAFEFRIMPTVKSLASAIHEKATAGFTARLTAGFCWPWSDPRADGTLVPDVQLNGWTAPWNARPESTRLAPGIPKSNFWASDPGGLQQVGCIYTAQGFEFDYVGVIFGLDLRYDPRTGSWLGDKSKSFDSVVKRGGDAFVDLVKNTYRVLLTRGMKGCFVFFEDEATEHYFRSRIEHRTAL